MQETMKKTKSNGVMTQQEYSSWIAALMKKTFLTKNEVSDLYGLGLAHVQRLFNQPNTDFVTYIGKRKVAEREKLDTYIREGKATGI